MMPPCLPIAETMRNHRTRNHSTNTDPVFKHHILVVVPGWFYIYLSCMHKLKNASLGLLIISQIGVQWATTANCIYYFSSNTLVLRIVIVIHHIQFGNNLLLLLLLHAKCWLLSCTTPLPFTAKLIMNCAFPSKTLYSAFRSFKEPIPHKRAIKEYKHCTEACCYSLKKIKFACLLEI